MVTASLYRQLVPAAPLHRRTDRDTYPSPEAELRARLAARLRPPDARPRLRAPTLVSSWQGTIDGLLMAFPSWGVADPALAAAYRSVITSMPTGTEFVVVHHRAQRASVEGWFAEAGHPAENVIYVPLADYVNFTDWAEDAYASVLDGVDGSLCLMEPWEFPRGGDALIAEAVQVHTGVRAGQAPLIFQGGNCLVGDRFWLLGKDYFADSLALVDGERPPVLAPPSTAPGDFVTSLYADYLDAGRELVVVGTDRPIALRELYGTRQGDEYFLDIAADGAGTYQPIFHIDMFLTLAGPAPGPGGRFRVLVGSPAAADRALGTQSPFALDDVYDAVASGLEGLGMEVVRNPLVHRPELGATFTLAELKAMAARPGNQVLLEPLAELAAAGAVDGSAVRVRAWHHVTWNNCLVEAGTDRRRVYLPTFGHPPDDDLAPLDAAMADLWAGLGFEVVLLGDFNPFARRQGVVHCITKYLRRGA